MTNTSKNQTSPKFSPEEVQEFCVEAADLLDQAESGLLEIDRTNDLQTAYDAVFRVFHSLKGGAGMLGLDPLQAHMHKLENQLGEIKSRGKISKVEISFFLRGVDASRKLLAGEAVSFDYNVEAESAPAPQPSPEAAKSTEPAQAEDASKKPSAKKDQALVYVVDDESELVDALKNILVANGMNAMGFTEPAKLLEQVKKTKPDLVISDINMPDMDGLGVLREIRKIDHDLPVIFISGYLTKDSLMEAIKFGVFATIEKPFREAEIIHQCLAATKQYRLSLLVNRSMNLLLYQFTDLDDFLKAQGKSEIRQTIKNEIEFLIETRRSLRQLQEITLTAKGSNASKKS